MKKVIFSLIAVMAVIMIACTTQENKEAEVEAVSEEAVEDAEAADALSVAIDTTEEVVADTIFVDAQQ